MSISKIYFYLLIVTIIYGCHTKNWVSLEKEQSVKNLQHCIKYDVGSSKFNAGPNILLPDEEAAIKVAESCLFKTYGKDQIISQRPYGIGFVNGNWIIVGNLPKLTIGGYFEIAINSTNGKVIGMAHGK